MRLLLIFVMTVSVLTGNIQAALLFSEGNQRIGIATPSIRDQAVEIYAQPGWVTNALREGGFWGGNEDLDALGKDLRIVIQMMTSDSIELSADAFLAQATQIFEAENFQLEKENILPMLHISFFLIPHEGHFFLLARAKLLEEVELKRETWTKDFLWQAVTWEKEIVRFADRSSIEEEPVRMIGELCTAFVKRFLKDQKTREEIQKEVDAIEAELDEEYAALQKEIRQRLEGLKALD